MPLVEQLNALRKRRGIRVLDLARLIGMAPSNLSSILNRPGDPRSSTLEAMAAGLNAQWCLVPHEHLPEVQQIIAGKGSGPDQSAPTAVDLFLAQGKSR